jgi:S1-C subfamily serine protease
MNTAIYTMSGSSAGIGFAIPVDTLSQVVSSILRDGFVTRPILGVTYLESSQARLLGIDKGILVLQSPATSPAGQAGIRGTSRTESGDLQLGDIITGVDEKSIATEADLFKAVQENHQVGDEVSVKVLRYNFPSKEAMQSGLGAGGSKEIVPESLLFKLRLTQSPERAEPSF